MGRSSGSRSKKHFDGQTYRTTKCHCNNRSDTQGDGGGSIEGDIHRAILQDAQFHPVNEMILHVDFLEIDSKKPIKIDVPVKIVGNSPGVIKGGKMVQKLRKVSLRGLVANIPDFVTADISGLDLGQTVKVNKLVVEGCEILNPMSNPVATIDIPRALRGKLTA
jgi:large subunit ribosomal protein L25